MARQSWWEGARDRIAATATAQRIWAWYESATPREQLYLKVGAAAVGALLIWLLVLSPLMTFGERARADYLQQRETVAWMQANRHRVGGPAAQPRAPGESLLGIANQTARAVGLSFRRYQPTGDNGLNLWLEGVPFNQLMPWLETLELEHGVVANELTITRRDEPGLVDARIVLEG
jgi:general secretion pathway protein M